MLTISLTATNDGHFSISMYVKLNVSLLRFEVPKVGTLITKDPNQLLDSKPENPSA